MEPELQHGGASAQPSSRLPEDSWLLDDFAWDPVAMVGARRATSVQPSTSRPEGLAPPRAAPVVALPAAAAPPAKKIGYTRRDFVCQVPGCSQPLNETPGAPRYCVRFRICMLHLRAEVVQMPNGAARHCQKCCCFHPLSAFRGANRTCAVKLAAQAARRRRQKAPPPDATGDLCFDFLQDFLVADDAAQPGTLPTALPALNVWSSGAATLPVVREATLKLCDTTPAGLPDTLAPTMASAWCDARALSLEATPRPGCTLLYLDALVLPAPGLPEPDAVQLARALHASSLRAWLRGQNLGVCCGGVAQTYSTHNAPPPLPKLPRFRPAAHLSTAMAELRAQRPVAPLPGGVAVHGRLHGQNLPALRLVTGSDGVLCLTLPACFAEGAARIWLTSPGTAASTASRAVLLTTDAAIAAEVSASLDSEDDDAVAEQFVCALGTALRPGCAPRVLAAAAETSLRRGLVATSTRLLTALQAALVSDADADSAAAARTLVHAAVLSRSPDLIQLTLQLGRDGLFGAPGAAVEGGVTPMHLAAAAGDSTIALALATATSTATLLWFAARSATGAAPADVAAARGSMADVQAPLWRRLKSARRLAATMAANEGVGAADADIVALANLMLQSYSPTGGPPCAREQELFDGHLLASRRHLLLLSPVISIFICGHVLLSSATPSFDGGRVSMSSWTSVFESFGRWAGRGAVGLWSRSSEQNSLDVSRQLPLWHITLVVNAALLALAGLPALRRHYQRHGHKVIYLYLFYQLLVQRVLVELHFQQVMSGDAARWPTPAAPALLALKVAHMLALPLPVSAVNKLLCVHWILMVCAHLAKAGTQTAQFVRDIALLTVVHVIMVATARTMDTRALAAWRAGRRVRLAKLKRD